MQRTAHRPVLCRLDGTSANRVSRKFTLSELRRTPSRNCLKSPVGTRNGAAQSPDTVLFGLFWSRYTGQFHARSGAQTPFQTVSQRTSENPQKAKFAEFLFHALGWI